MRIPAEACFPTVEEQLLLQVLSPRLTDLTYFTLPAKQQVKCCTSPASALCCGKLSGSCHTWSNCGYAGGAQHISSSMVGGGELPAAPSILNAGNIPP